jgi:transposase
MDQARIHEGIRRMLEALLERQEESALSQVEAAEMLGMSERSFRRWRDRLRAEGEAGLADRRLGKPSSRRGASEEISRMLRLYRERRDNELTAICFKGPCSKVSPIPLALD